MKFEHAEGGLTPAQQFLAKESKKRKQTSKIQATYESERLRLVSLDL
jgi:hypothetical protein